MGPRHPWYGIFWLLYRAWFIALKSFHGLQEALLLTFNLLHKRRRDEIVYVRTHIYVQAKIPPHPCMNVLFLLTCAATAQPSDWPIGRVSKNVLEKSELWTNGQPSWQRPL